MRRESRGSMEPLEALLLKSEIPDGEDLVQQEDVGIEMGGDGKSQPRYMPEE